MHSLILRVMATKQTSKAHLIFFSALILCLISCETRRENVPLDDVSYVEYTNQSVKGEVKLNLESLYYPIDSSGWEVVVNSESEKDVYFSLRKMDGDTSKFLSFFSDKSQTLQKIDTYVKEFYSEDVKHHVCMHEDTFYYYTEGNDGSKQFLKGEYNYRFENVLLSPKEMGYYLLYRDSLGEVKGSGLPNLPSLTPEEEKRLNELEQSE